jgi:hypothetical protein
MGGCSLKGLLVLTTILVSGCVSHKQVPQAKHDLSFFESKLSPEKLFKISAEYLEWQMGYPIKVRNPERGLLVTTWIEDQPNHRSQITIKITKHPYGSLLSTHIAQAARTEAGWAHMPTNNRLESKMVSEIRSAASSVNN